MDDWSERAQSLEQLQLTDADQTGSQGVGWCGGCIEGGLGYYANMACWVGGGRAGRWVRRRTADVPPQGLTEINFHSSATVLDAKGYLAGLNFGYFVSIHRFKS